ncbi:hypothetical protein FRC17_008947 [Serendipita sp. 399]|nr:hypothetical protein FRC17_008947 [Serendipita sp. 399]
MRKRTLKTLKKGLKDEQGTKSISISTDYRKERAEYLYFQCQQLLLRLQIAALRRLWSLPLEFEAICRDVWSLNLTMLSKQPEAAPLVDQEHAVDSEGEESESERSGSDSQTSDEEDEPLDQGKTTELSALLDDLSGTSSEDEEPTEENYASTQPHISMIRSRKRPPALYGESAANIAVLVEPPGTLRLHRLASRLANKMNNQFSIVVPEANVPFILSRSLEALHLPVIFYPMAIKLLGILDVSLTLHPSLAGLSLTMKGQDLKRRVGENIPVEMAVACALALLLKLSLGLDLPGRVERNQSEAKLGLPPKQEILSRLEEDNSRSAFLRTADQFSDEEIDHYLDFCTRSLLNITIDTDQPMQHFFPVPPTIGQGSAMRSSVSERSDRIQHSEPPTVPGLDPKSTRQVCGRSYRIYDTNDALGSLPSELKTVVTAAARWCEVDEDDVAKILEIYERRLKEEQSMDLHRVQISTTVIKSHSITQHNYAALFIVVIKSGMAARAGGILESSHVQVQRSPHPYLRLTTPMASSTNIHTPIAHTNVKSFQLMDLENKTNHQPGVPAHERVVVATRNTPSPFEEGLDIDSLSFDSDSDVGPLSEDEFEVMDFEIGVLDEYSFTEQSPKEYCMFRYPGDAHVPLADDETRILATLLAHWTAFYIWGHHSESEEDLSVVLIFHTQQLHNTLNLNTEMIAHGLWIFDLLYDHPQFISESGKEFTPCHPFRRQLGDKTFKIFVAYVVGLLVALKIKRNQAAVECANALELEEGDEDALQRLQELAELLLYSRRSAREDPGWPRWLRRLREHVLDTSNLDISICERTTVFFAIQIAVYNCTGNHARYDFAVQWMPRLLKVESDTEMAKTLRQIEATHERQQEVASVLERDAKGLVDWAILIIEQQYIGNELSVEFKERLMDIHMMFHLPVMHTAFTLWNFSRIWSRNNFKTVIYNSLPDLEEERFIAWVYFWSAYTTTLMLDDGPPKTPNSSLFKEVGKDLFNRCHIAVLKDLDYRLHPNIHQTLDYLEYLYVWTKDLESVTEPFILTEIFDNLTRVEEDIGYDDD